GTAAHCSAVRRGTRPGGGCARSASGPPSRPRLSHWLTALWLTPSAAAIVLPVQPCSCNSSARSRRPSRQSRGGRCFFLAMHPSVPDERWTSPPYAGVSRQCLHTFYHLERAWPAAHYGG